MFDIMEYFPNAKKLTGSEAILTEGNKQKHTILLDGQDEVFRVRPDEIISELKKFKSVESCDYLLINTTKNHLLYCELKDQKAKQYDKAKCSRQLNNASYFFDFVCHVAGFNSNTNFEFKKTMVVFSCRALNKQKTKRHPEIRRHTYQKKEHLLTGRKELKWEQLCN